MSNASETSKKIKFSIAKLMPKRQRIENEHLR